MSDDTFLPRRRHWTYDAPSPEDTVERADDDEEVEEDQELDPEADEVHADEVEAVDLDPLPLGQNRLIVLTNEILQYKGVDKEAGLASATARIEMGKRLIEVQAGLRDERGHGHWISYLRDTVKIHPRLAQVYMRQARSGLKSDSIRILSDKLVAEGLPAKLDEYEGYERPKKPGRPKTDLDEPSPPRDDEDEADTEPFKPRDGEVLYIEWHCPDGEANYGYIWAEKSPQLAYHSVLVHLKKTPSERVDGRRVRPPSRDVVKSSYTPDECGETWEKMEKRLTKWSNDTPGIVFQDLWAFDAAVETVVRHLWLLATCTPTPRPSPDKPRDDDKC